MDKRSTWAGRAGFKGVLALSALAAVVVPASPAGAATSVGRFTTLTAGTNLGMEIDGVAVLSRTGNGTTGRIVVFGLKSGVTYAAHLHNQPCTAANPGGGHYMDVPGAARPLQMSCGSRLRAIPPPASPPTGLGSPWVGDRPTGWRDPRPRPS